MHETIRNRVVEAVEAKSPWEKTQRLRGLRWSRSGSNRRPLECDSSRFLCAAKEIAPFPSCRCRGRLQPRGFGVHDEIPPSPGARMGPETREIGHLGVAKAIRVEPGDVDQFVAERRRSGPTGGRGGRQ